MTDFLKKEIYKKLEEGKILVFPTEESARNVAVSYSRDMGKSILSRMCISFDTFSSLFYENPEGSKEASDIDISIFSNWFTNKYSKKLEYFYSSQYPEMEDFLPSFISKMIPDLEEALSDKLNLEKRAFHDLAFIEKSYLEFLKKNNLYQINYEEINQSVDVSTFFLVAPDAFPKEIKLERKLYDVAINKINSYPNSSKLYVYDYEKEEIRALFTNIRNILDSGVGLEEIAISTSALERLKPYLELEARLFDVPLQFVSGTMVLDTLPGKFLSDIQQIYSDGYQIEDMKEFFLNPTMPFKDKYGARSFIAKAVQFSIVNSINARDDRYARIYMDSSFSYRDFRRALDRLMTEKDARRCQQYFQELLNVLFGSERFIDDEEDNNVFGYIQDNLKKFLDSILSAEENGYNVQKPIFPIFISYLKDVRYVSRKKTKGINIYPFGQGATTPYKYHFLITLNESESKSIVKEAGFLSEFERNGIDDEDVTKNLLDVYSSFSENVYLSSSRRTYQGEVLPLVLLMDRQENRKYTSSDSYRIENSSNREHSVIYPLQLEGYERGKRTSLRDYRRGEFIGDKKEDTYLSFTAISDYEKCHFKYALINRFGLRNLPAYEISTYDAIEIGNRLHSILERFDRFCPLNDIDQIESVFDQEMKLWQDGKRFNYNQELDAEEILDIPSGSAIPSDQMVKYLKKAFLENLKKITKEIREETITLKNGQELKLNGRFEEYGFNLTGKVDKIARSKTSGNLVIYDYKSGKKYTGKALQEKKLQFDIYRLLISRYFDDDVDKGAYVFLKNGQIVTGWEPDTNHEVDAINRISLVNEGVMNGDWNKVADSNECSGCEFKGICRRRMEIQ